MISEEEKLRVIVRSAIDSVIPDVAQEENNINLNETLTAHGFTEIRERQIQAFLDKRDSAIDPNHKAALKIILLALVDGLLKWYKQENKNIPLPVKIGEETFYICVENTRRGDNAVLTHQANDLSTKLAALIFNYQTNPIWINCNQNSSTKKPEIPRVTPSIFTQSNCISASSTFSNHPQPDSQFGPVSPIQMSVSSALPNCNTFVGNAIHPLNSQLLDSTDVVKKLMDTHYYPNNTCEDNLILSLQSGAKLRQDCPPIHLSNKLHFIDESNKEVTFPSQVILHGCFLDTEGVNVNFYSGFITYPLNWQTEPNGSYHSKVVATVNGTHLYKVDYNQPLSSKTTLDKDNMPSGSSKTSLPTSSAVQTPTQHLEARLRSYLGNNYRTDLNPQQNLIKFLQEDGEFDEKEQLILEGPLEFPNPQNLVVKFPRQVTLQDCVLTMAAKVIFDYGNLHIFTTANFPNTEVPNVRHSNAAKITYPSNWQTKPHETLYSPLVAIVNDKPLYEIYP